MPIGRLPIGPHGKQFAVFLGVGCLATLVHYGLLVSLVEGYRLDPVPSALAGYVVGGIVSYFLNRRLTFASERPHGEAVWRFAAVAGIGFALTWGAMGLLTRFGGVRYLLAQVLTTGLVLFWSYGANKLWTFRGSPLPPLT